MFSQEVRYVVVGTHEYQWALRPFAHLFARYWGGDPLLYVGDRLNGPLPDNVEFMQVPAYREGIWNWGDCFSNGLRSAFEVLGEPIIALFLPDHWIVADVDRAAVGAMVEFMQGRKVLRGNLAANTSLDHYHRVLTNVDGVDIVVCPDVHHCGLEAGTAMSPALWNREMLIRLLEPHWSLWDTEVLGSQKMQRHFKDWISMGTFPAAFGRINGLRRGREVYLDGLAQDDKAIVREMIPNGWTAVE